MTRPIGIQRDRLRAVFLFCPRTLVAHTKNTVTGTLANFLGEKLAKPASAPKPSAGWSRSG